MGHSSDAREYASPLAKLGLFLRGRRMLLTPGELDPTSRRRRIKGLRREEVAMRAGISVDWYTRIELGTGVVPSVETLQAIATALEFGPLDTQYLFELTALPMPTIERPPHGASLTALEQTILLNERTAAVVYDWFGSPLCWNATADGLFRWSRFADPFDRNMIVAGLTDTYYREFFGDEFEAISRRVVGLFRRAYTTADPPPLARRVYGFAARHPFFRTMWNELNVAEDHAPPGPFVRFVPEVGKLRLDASDLVPLHRRDLIFRVIAPHDAATRAKFPRIARLGTASQTLASEDFSLAPL